MRRCREEVSDAWQDCFFLGNDAVAAEAARAGDVVTGRGCVLVFCEKFVTRLDSKLQNDNTLLRQTLP